MWGLTTAATDELEKLSPQHEENYEKNLQLLSFDLRFNISSYRRYLIDSKIYLVYSLHTE